MLNGEKKWWSDNIYIQNVNFTIMLYIMQKNNEFCSLFNATVQELDWCAKAFNYNAVM